MCILNKLIRVYGIHYLLRNEITLWQQKILK